MRRAVLVMLIVALSVIAFQRGSFLLGTSMGLAYAGIAGGSAWIVSRCLVARDRYLVLRLIGCMALAIPIGLVMWYPAAVNRDVQIFIDRQATDRAIRAELRTVFSSNPAYRHLTVSTTHLKVINVTIRGSLETRAELGRLHVQIERECPTLALCPLHWDVRLRVPSEGLRGLDSELFERSAPSARND